MLVRTTMLFRVCFPAYTPHRAHTPYRLEALFDLILRSVIIIRRSLVSYVFGIIPTMRRITIMGSILCYLTPCYMCLLYRLRLASKRFYLYRYQTTWTQNKQHSEPVKGLRLATCNVATPCAILWMDAGFDRGVLGMVPYSMSIRRLLRRFVCTSADNLTYAQ